MAAGQRSLSKMRGLMKALTDSPGKASANAEQQWSTYQLWRANEAMLRVSTVICVLMAVRFVALLTCAPLWSGVHAAALVLLGLVSGGVAAGLRVSREESGMRACILVQVLLLTVAQLIGLLNADAAGVGLGALGNDFAVHRWFQGPIVIFMTTPAIIYLPMRWYLCLLLPLHLGILTVFQYACAGPVGFRFLMQCCLQAVVNIFVFFLNDRREGGLYQSVLATDRERRLLEAAQSVLQGMLDSLFDAACVCSARGVIRTSTPQMDQILGAGAPTIPAGSSLADFARDASERQRLENFIDSLSQCASARKIHLSMLTPAGPLEVTMSGIRFSEPGGAEEGSIFIGVQVSEGVPAEVYGPAADGPETSPAQEAFMQAVAQRQLAPKSLENLDGGSVLDDLVSQSAHWGAQAPSYVSAPAVLQKAPLLQDFRPPPVCPSGGPEDCLPPDAVVWVEGQALPVKVGLVTPGQRLLCYDQLTGAMKFAQVLGAATQPAESADWVIVTLDDGTELTMTADHPVLPHSAKAEPAGPASRGGPAPRVVRAGELKPGAHSLEVLKMAPVPVKEVKVQADAPASRVAISIRQPERHTVFVAPGSGTESKQSMAVACANLVAPASVEPRPQLKNTFLHFREDDSEEPSSLKRSVSAPILDMELERASMTSSNYLRRAGSAERGTNNSLTAGSVRSSMKSSYCSSVTSRVSAGDAFVQVGSICADRRQCGAEPCSAANLSLVIRAQRLGLGSLGSLNHDEGLCRPCLMQHWFVTGKEGVEACKYGLMCSRCHEPHPEDLFKRMQKERRTAQGSRLRRRCGGPRREACAEGTL